MLSKKENQINYQITLNPENILINQPGTYITKTRQCTIKNI